MQPLKNGKGASQNAPKVVLAEEYEGRFFDNGEYVLLPAGTEVRQSETGARIGTMQAKLNGIWFGIQGL